MKAFKIKPKQIQLIKMMQRNLGISDDDYRDLLQSRFEESSCKDLSSLQAGYLIEEFKLKGAHYVPRKKVPYKSRKAIKGKFDTVIQLASQAEKDKIDAISELIVWKYENGLTLWMKKRFKIERVRTTQEAFLVIEGLKKMFENGMKKMYGPDWWVTEWRDDKIQRYVREHIPKRYNKQFRLRSI